MKQEQSVTEKIVQIGVFGGLFWGAVWYFLHIFSFTVPGPNYLLLPFALGDWKEGVWGNIAGIICMGILSVVVAFIYKAVLSKFEGLISGIIYGLVWWGLLFFVIPPVAPVIKSMMEMPKETIVTTACIFILYGVFIGYSVSFEVNNNASATDEEKTNYSNK
ncbi:Conserved membrane protein YqhR [Bacillus sp. 491mf]|uniref:YqhR family membrane protein n=1 Tax=unclassified Bacillus (in: firmicutes) TaxID=185979 RepID=UPI0005504328|nr:MULTISPECIES: YqhR family membrane protein [unclassified Bacillus (in: firmicutes)]SFC47987.1 Conserved membrane protein YqhR [Bacillus sp. 491mf]